MKSLYPPLYRGIIHPLFHALKRDGFNAVEREVLAMDALDAAGLARVQREKFARLLRDARARCPYYREVIDAGAAEAALEGTPPHELGLPLLTKKVIRERLNDLVAEGIDPSRLIPNSTSGSTGEPMRFYTDLHATLWRRSVDIRNRRWLGIPHGEPRAQLWGSQIDNQRASSIRGRLHSLVNRLCVLDAYDLSEPRMAEYVATLQAFGPLMLVGYPHALVRFGEWCESEGQSILSLRAIVTSAEALYEDQRLRIQETLGAPVYDRYGCREVGCIAHERPGAEGVVINADRVLIELLDERGRPVPEGDLGSIYVTDLDSHAMPLIRYAIGDLAVAAPPSAAQTYPALARVEGRSLDVVRSPDGRAVGGTYWTILLRSRPGLRQFQVVQEQLDRLRILYRRDPDVAQPDFQHFLSGIRKTCGESVRVDFEEVDRISAEPNGKFRVVKSLVSAGETRG